MRRLYAALSLAFAFALHAAAGCGDEAPLTTGSTGTGGAGTGGMGASSSTTSSTGVGGDSSIACAMCLDKKCAAEEAACDMECHALQACIDSVCFNLSANGFMDEGACYVHCQDLHMSAKAAHLAVVNCANAGPCNPPCAGAPYDFDQCEMRTQSGSCKSDYAACIDSPDCLAYKACVSTCTTLNDCLGCASGASGSAGEALYEAYQFCVSQSCIAEEWVPHF
jgi:hypothetical protein